MSNGHEPRAPRDATIIRPQPGGRKALGSAPAPAPAAAPQAAPPPMAEPGRAAPLSDFLAASSNDLLAAAAPLLALGARLRTSVHQADVEALRRQTIEEIRNFEGRAAARGVPSDLVQIARYVLCTFLDRAVLSTPWGSQSHWAAQSLLAGFHREVDGRPKFFQILERALAEPARYGALVELQHSCLLLGFEAGGTSAEADGRADLMERARRFVVEQRRADTAALSVNWRGVDSRGRPLARALPWWLVALAALALLFPVYVYYRAALNEQSRPLQAALAAVPLEAPAPAAVPSRLKPLLADAERAGEVVVEDYDDRTVVTIVAPQLFRSGSASVDDRYLPVLRTIAAAAEQVPGRLLVVGHTDDVPVRSFAFKDNFDLSRARASAVAELLKGILSAPWRVESTGVADTQPRYQPASLPENRARNRRVEIVHFPESVR